MSRMSKTKQHIEDVIDRHRKGEPQPEKEQWLVEDWCYGEPGGR